MVTQRGFTLIELSIVLVIIGLIVGGVLMGRDLIEAARLRSVITEKEKLATAMETFRLKYNCIAGDCNNASELFPNAVNGGGDDMVNGSECFHQWHHLGAAGLVNGNFDEVFGYRPEVPGEDTPASSFSSNVGWFSYYVGITGNYSGSGSSDIYDRRGRMLLLGGVDDIPAISYAYVFGAVSTEQARTLENKVDDGNPSSGQLISLRPRTADGSAWDTICMDANYSAASGTANWNPGETGQNCRLGFFF